MADAYLTEQAKHDLMVWIAANGENYDAYKRYAESRSWPIYTPAYLHNWVNRRRAKVQELRAQQDIEVRKMSTFDRDKRVATLERGVERIEKRLDEDGEIDPEKEMKLLEQQRKLLQAIAVERNEWNKTPAGDDDDVGDLRTKMLAAMGELALKIEGGRMHTAYPPRLPEPIVQGEFTEVEEPAEEAE